MAKKKFENFHIRLPAGGEWEEKVLKFSSIKRFPQRKNDIRSFSFLRFKKSAF
jgi:hypothetical protein